MIETGKRYLVTTDNWFVAPDGESYTSAWGTCRIRKTEEVFGFTPQRPSTNWFLEVGSEDKGMIIAGCQIHFAIRCEDRPVNKIEETVYVEKETGIEKRASRIYMAE